MTNASTSLLGEKAASYHVPSASAPSRRPAARKAPAFKSLVGGDGSGGGGAAAAIGADAVSFIFCKCGGPGSLIQLLPCAHASLCMACAQKETQCPACGATFSDSRPSFRAAKR